MQRVKLGLVCLSWLYLAGAVSAQTAVDPTGSSGIASTSGTATVQQDMSGGGVLNGTYFDIRHVIGDGVGYQNSYSQIGAFTPFWFEEDTMIAPNARLIVTNSTQTGVNAGLVARRYVEGLDRLFGVYSYYDNDQDSRNFRYEQVMIGAETLGNWWDLRANGYMVSGNNNNFISALGVSGNPYYVGHNIDFLGKQLRDQALSGVDIEAGIPLTPTTPWLRGYSGAYGYRVGSGTTVGYRGRIEAMVSNDLTLGVMVSQDSIYGTNVNGTIDFKFSGFNPTRYFPNMTTRQRMLNPVQRNWRIATRTYVEDVNIAAINPETNKPYFITHVDNSNANPGDGTIENPYHNLTSAPQADIILVHLGNATSVANAVTGSAVLTNNQRLLGDGVLSTVNLFAQYGNESISGIFNLPGTSNSGNYAYVKNPAGNAVTLANYNEVAGLNLIGSSGSAITNTAAGSHNFYLHNLEIAGNGGKGIALTSASGIGIINNINVGTTNHANPLGLGNNAGGGIVMSTGGPGLNLALSNVFMNANPAGSQAVGVSLTANLGSLNADFNNVFANGNTTGIFLSESSQLLTANMNLVRANNNTGVGIKAQGTGGEITINANNIAAMNNGSDNLQIGTNAAPIVTSTVNVVLNDANFNGSTGGSGIVFSQSGGTGNLSLPATSSIGNAVDGLGIYGSNNAVQNVSVVNGQFMNNGQDAFHVEGNTGATINLFVDPTNASGSGRNGLYYAMGTDSVLNATFLNNSLDNSGGSAVYGQLANFATGNLYFDGTTGANSGGDGFYLNAINSSTANIQLLHGTFAGSNRLGTGSSAFNISADHSNVNFLANMVLANNQLAGSPTIGNQQYGLRLDLQNSSLFQGAIQNGNLSDNLLNAVNVNVANTSDASLSVYNTPSVRSGADGFVANVDNNSTLATNFRLSDLNNSGLNGVKLSVTNASTVNSTFDNSNINNSAADGINASVTGATSSAIVTLLNGGTVNNSGANGLNFNVDAGTLGVQALTSSFSNSGLNGVLGTVANGGLTQLSFINTAVNNNIDNGVFVTANTGGNIQAEFSIQSISNNGLTTNADGIRLDLDGAINSFLNVTNGATISGNGNDGVAITALNSTVFSSNFNLVSILNNGAASPILGQNRAGFDVTASNSSVTNTFNGVSIGNSAAGGTQQVGYISDVSTTGTLVANFTTTNLTNNAANAINSTVESGSSMTMNLLNTTGNSSGNTGAVFNVTGASNLYVASATNSGFSNNGGGGLLVSVDGVGSVANFGLDQIQLNNNGSSFGGQGFLGFITGGATLNAVIQNGSSISANSNQGIELIAANAGSKVNFQISETDVNDNASEGLLISVADQAELNYRSVFTNYNSNGFNGTLDGVSVTATGNGPSDSAIARLLFAGDNVNNNAGDGFSLNASNGATLTTSMTSVTATGNGGYGVNASAVDTFTKFNLLMNGTNTFSGNALGPISPLNFSNIDQAVIVLTGVFNGSTGDGIHASFDTVNSALFALYGPGTVSNNAGDGVDVSMKDVTNGSILLNGVNAISNNGGDGVRITLDNTTAGLDIFGTTALAGNGARGIDITLGNGSSLVTGIPMGAVPLEVLTLTDNLTPVSPLDNLLPKPVTTDLNTLGVVAQTALVIEGQNVSNSGAEGISLSLNASTIQAGESFLYYNNVTGSQGDGIVISATNTSSADGMRIVGTSSSGNTGNGLNVVGNGASFRDMVITSGTTTINTGLDFTIVGDTFGAGTGVFNLINTSTTAGENVTSFTMDTSTSVSGAIFNTVSGSATPFTPFGGTDTATGLTSVNGTAVPPYPAGLVPDFSQLLQLAFNNFAPGANFQWDNDFDLTPGGDESVFGNDLIGTTINVGFTGGLTLNGALVALPGTTDGAHFVATSGNLGVASFSTNGLDGIRFSLNNTDMSNLSVTDTTISGNGTAGTGHGINFTGSGGTVASSTLDNVVIAGNTISLNTGDGLHLVNPQTTNSLIQMKLTDNSISSNGLNGVNLSLVNGAQDLHASFIGNSITQNATGAGVNIRLAANHNMTGGFDRNTIGSNGTQGVNFNMGVNGRVNSDFTNNVINGNGSDGIKISLQTGGQYVGTTFYGNTIGTATSRNGGMGINLDAQNSVASNATAFTLNLGDTTKAANLITGNVGAGVGITMSGHTIGTLNIANTSFSNTTAGSGVNFTGEGLRINQAGTSTLTGGITSSSFTNNAADGALFNVTGNNVGAFASINTFAIDNSTFSSNGGDGLEFFRTADGEVNNVTITNSVINSNTQNGLVIRAANKFGGHTDTYTINNNDISSNGVNGVLFDERADAHLSANMDLNTITNNTGNGIQLVEQVNNPSDLRQLTGTWTQNVITGNKGNGISLDGATSGLVIGDANSYALGNNISNNSLSGVKVTGAGSLTIGSNLIQLNGTLANLGTVNENAGILLDVAPVSNITVSHNIVTDNFGDGIQYGISARFDGGFGSLDINNNNIITNNSGRGIDVINRGNNTERVNIENNFVSANDLEGIYVVNTASRLQNQFDSSTLPLLADGNVLNDPDLQLRVVGNQIIGNGLNSGLSGTGLVIRVGTSNGSNSFTDDGGFASSGATIAPDASKATFFGSITSTRGGVTAQVDSNILGGNFGDDVLFNSFVSTVTPATTAGTWSATQFTVTGTYESDPLSRFDLYFRGNTTDAGAIDSLGTSLNGYNSRNPALVAFYNNAEGTFKSRLIAATPTANDGPFTSADRARNATRQAARINSFRNPIDGSDGTPPTFLYSGMGSSTWRASSDSTAILLPGVTDLASPLTNTSQAQGVFLNSPPGNGEQPFGWGFFP